MSVLVIAEPNSKEVDRGTLSAITAAQNISDKISLLVLDDSEEVLKNCDFITPNYEEIEALFPEKSIEDTIDFISERTNIYLKGGHRTDKKGWDEVYYSKIVKLNIPPIAETVFQKHGSGCVLSSALASNLEKGMNIEDACKNVKWYTEQFLNSNKSLLGTHKYTENVK